MMEKSDKKQNDKVDKIEKVKQDIDKIKEEKIEKDKLEKPEPIAPIIQAKTPITQPKVVEMKAKMDFVNPYTQFSKPRGESNAELSPPKKTPVKLNRAK